MYKKIVIPLDLTDKKSTKSLFTPALEFVKSFGAQVHLVHIIPDFGIQIVEDYLPRGWKTAQKAKSEKYLKEIVDKYVPEEIRAKVKTYIGHGAIYDQVISYSDKIEADLIITYAVRVELKDYMLGPNASKIVRHSKISVLVIRE